jgi:hypothetical protein
MGSYSDLLRAIKYYESHKNDYKENLIEVKYIFKIPVLWVKKNKYTKTYYLFNFIPIYSVTVY